MADVATLGHGRHDRLAIAAAADRDRPGGRLPALTRAMLAACTECARLHDDLRALAAALPSAATPRRTREFTLSPADAERLRPRGLRRWLGLIGTSRDSITRPLALGFTTLGIAGLLVATVPAVLPMAGSGAAASSAPTVELEAAGAPDDPGFQQAVGDPIGPTETRQGTATSDATATIALSAGFLAAGGGLLLVRRQRSRVMP